MLTGEIVFAAQKAVTIRQNFQHAFCVSAISRLENLRHGGIAGAIIFVVISFGIARPKIPVAFKSTLFRAVVRGVKSLLKTGLLIAALLLVIVLLLIGVLLIVVALIAALLIAALLVSAALLLVVLLIAALR